MQIIAGADEEYKELVYASDGNEKILEAIAFAQTLGGLLEKTLEEYKNCGDLNFLLQKMYETQGIAVEAAYRRLGTDFLTESVKKLVYSILRGFWIHGRLLLPMNEQDFRGEARA